MKNLPINSLTAIKDKKIVRFFKSVPHLYFSDKGFENIAKRFDVSVEQIKTLINNMKGGYNNGK